ncbi:hypothetical protein HK105_204034 [Polyrhizophydium stewartii]|uniref:Uncharacterized protein n=1 Tax=Polyrhizophydium stewartii TaxID=2732419 RepID=A0ABR4N9U1_9FUNG
MRASRLRRSLLLAALGVVCLFWILCGDRGAPRSEGAGASSVSAFTQVDDDAAGALALAQARDGVRLVASLTTIPGQMEYVGAALRSVFNQTLPVDAVHLHVPLRLKRLGSSIDEARLAADIEELQAEFGHKLLIHRGDDYGPATKLLGTLLHEKDPRTLVVTLDDDVEYDPRTVQALYQGARDHPGSAICVGCEEVVNLDRRHWAAVEQQRYCRGWVRGFKGVLYAVGMFDRSVFDFRTVPYGCFVHDDVHLSGMLYSRGMHPFHLGLEFDTVTKHHRQSQLSISAMGGAADLQAECIGHFNGFFNEV